MKWIGALLVLAGCGFLGFYTAAAQNMEEKNLRKLIAALDFMSCELQYRLTPLPELCAQAAQETTGALKKAFSALSYELNSQVAPDVKSCMHAALSSCGNLPTLTRQCLEQLGNSMGRFDLPGQIQAIESVRTVCRNHVAKLESGKDVRLRSYQTLGLCAGAALVIIFV